MINQLELTPDVCDNMLQMMRSSDKDNLTIAAETIRHIDVVENLPYLLVMYKESTTEVRSTVFMETIENKLKLTCRHVNFDEPVTYNSIFNEIMYHNVSTTAMEYFLNKFSVNIKRQMMEWGFSFLSQFDIKLIPITNATRASGISSKNQ
jgi:hypothetical protein